MAATLTTGPSTRHAVPARTVRAGRGGSRPPTRRPPVGAPRVVAPADCAPRRSPVPLAALVAIALAVAALVYGFGAYSGAMAESTVPTTTAVVRVGVGETLYDLAARTAPGSDSSAVVDRIRQLNGLDSVDVYPGQPLTVPVSRG
ncbi:LysM peptidoglycan-binding domain-containing protein [Actinokineospora soli]|uniref:LysM peptidoglycan-binding domain-containing protein n=1 Tax=Actinokineospora soli TaxID=1048753 RepID=A0ABW2TJD3_9PSEU